MKYIEQYERMMRWYDRLEKMYEGRPIEHKLIEDADPSEQFNSSVETKVSYRAIEEKYAEDVAYAFFQNCYHFFEWLGKDNSTEPLKKISKKDTSNYVRSNNCLTICHDLCTNTKHLLLKWTPWTGDPNIKIDKVHLTFGYDLKKAILTRRYFCKISFGGQEHDALQVANECIEKWHQFMRQHNITIPPFVSGRDTPKFGGAWREGELE